MEKIFEFCAAMSMKVGNTLFKRKASHLVTSESGPSKPKSIIVWLGETKESF